MPDLNIDAHYSNDMKVKRPSVNIAAAPQGYINNTKLFSEDEANKKVQEMNTDIYEKASKERAKHEFNSSLYFKIFGGVILGAAGIAGYNKIKKFFRKP